MADRSQAVRWAAAVAILLGGGYTVATLTTGSTEPSADQPRAAAPASPAAESQHHPTHDHPAHDDAAHDHSAHDHSAHDHSAHDHSAAARGDGTSAAVAGYRLEQLKLVGDRLRFRVANRAGTADTAFATHHQRPLHLFVFSTDLSDFRHVHPAPDRAGTWSVEVPDLAPGSVRVVAEFTPTVASTPVVLGDEVTAPGTAEPQPLPETATATKVDGYTVRLVEDALVAGYRTQLRVTISGPDGDPADLRPYLGSWAHAALVNTDTLALLHLHPVEEYVAGAPSPRHLVLTAQASEPGEHRLVVEFATGSGVHQAEFTVRAVP